MSDEIHDEEERDLMDPTGADLRAMPLYLTSPERIGLAIGDELEDWNSEFNDCIDVTWHEGEPPVQVSIGYVRADLFDRLRTELGLAEVTIEEQKRAAAGLRAELKEAEAGELRNALAVGNACIELQEERKDNERLRATVARQRAWIDGVMAQPIVKQVNFNAPLIARPAPFEDK